jgi:hypothetical protein
MIAPVVKLAGYVVTAFGVWLGLLNVPFALLFLRVAWGYGMLLSIWGIVENSGYRQLTVWFRLRAFWSAIRYRHVRRSMTRTGFAPARAGAQP